MKSFKLYTTETEIKALSVTFFFRGLREDRGEREIGVRGDRRGPGVTGKTGEWGQGQDRNKIRL